MAFGAPWCSTRELREKDRERGVGEKQREEKATQRPPEGGNPQWTVQN